MTQNIVDNLTKNLIDTGCLDIKDMSGKIYYKSSRLRDSEWYAKTKLARELLLAEEKLEALLEEFYCDQQLLELIENKTNLTVHSMPNTKYTLVDVVFCLYLKERFLNLANVTLVKHVPVDEPWFVETPECGIEIIVKDSKRPVKFVMEVEGHRFMW